MATRRSNHSPSLPRRRGASDPPPRYWRLDWRGLPTLAARYRRQAVAEAIDAALPLPFERTTVNGLGFLQIVRRRARASLPELLRADPAGARRPAPLLRTIERTPPPVPQVHRVSRASTRADAHPAWIAEASRRAGQCLHRGAMSRSNPARCAASPRPCSPRSAAMLRARDLLQWLGEGYRVPPAGRHGLFRRLDSDGDSARRPALPAIRAARPR